MLQLFIRLILLLNRLLFLIHYLRRAFLLEIFGFICLFWRFWYLRTFQLSFRFLPICRHFRCELSIRFWNIIWFRLNCRFYILFLQKWHSTFDMFVRTLALALFFGHILYVMMLFSLSRLFDLQSHHRLALLPQLLQRFRFYDVLRFRTLLWFRIRFVVRVDIFVRTIVVCFFKLVFHFTLILSIAFPFAQQFFICVKLPL